MAYNEGRQQRHWRKYDWSTVLRKRGTNFEVGHEEVQRGFLSDRKGKVIPHRGVEDMETNNGTGMGINTAKSGTRNLETESISNRAESMGGCVKLDCVYALLHPNFWCCTYKHTHTHIWMDTCMHISKHAC